jgi:hypothetical protein
MGPFRALEQIGMIQHLMRNDQAGRGRNAVVEHIEKQLRGLDAQQQGGGIFAPVFLQHMEQMPGINVHLRIIVDKQLNRERLALPVPQPLVTQRNGAKNACGHGPDLNLRN